MILAVGVLIACKRDPVPTNTPGPSASVREPPPDLPFADVSEGPREGGTAGEVTPGPPTPAEDLDRPLDEAVTDVDAAKRALAQIWPDLEVSCWSIEGCFGRAELDGDGELDAAVMVRESCAQMPCPVGMVIFSSRGRHLRLGAGQGRRMPRLDWEQGAAGVVFTPDGEVQLDADWSSYQAVELSPTLAPSACADALALGHDALVYSGSDAAEAVIWHDEGWYSVDCGY